MLPNFLQSLVGKGDDRAKLLASKFRHIQNSHFQSLQSAESDPSHPQHISIGYQPNNLDKNRYTDIFPFDTSRVILSTLQPYTSPPLTTPSSSPSVHYIETIDDEDGDPRDYINASHVRFPHVSKHYIAAQGPLPTTIGDFWRMCWEQDVRVVVMLTGVMERGRKKCEQYWPSVLNRMECVREGLVVIGKQEQGVQVNGLQVVKRTFVVKSKDGVRKEVVQLHALDWPDHGVPEDSRALLELVKVARSEHDAVNNKGPMVVHCSAGCGRTGTFCAVDSIMAMYEHYPASMASKQDVVYEQVIQLREQRVIMVQSFVQYAYCYDVLKEWFQTR